ncbi:hypothetical protein [Rubrobacter xylanophilus]|uniref:hypothetical protein n=1 Tax=Rubrobacter xylanophilus TaxID=49319 RepID=UPI0000460C78|nr:hypothetical protein [Rubrobacter xylanophilus]
MAGAQRQEGPTVLVAIQPRAYNHAIGRAIGTLRPEWRVRVVEPDDLPEKLAGARPQVVLCSQPCRAPGRGRPCWIEFYPRPDSAEVELRVDGEGGARGEVALEELLSLLDRRVAARAV